MRWLFEYTFATEHDRLMKSDLTNLSTDTASLIRKHLLGTATPDEHTKLAEWISSDPANQQLFINVGIRFKKDLELKDLCQPKDQGKKRTFRSFLKELFTCSKVFFLFLLLFS